MKIVKTLLVVLVAALTFGTANAQIRIKARIGEPAHHRVVVVHRRPIHRYHHRPMVVVKHHR